jgi:hypothetical protein
MRVDEADKPTGSRPKQSVDEGEEAVPPVEDKKVDERKARNQKATTANDAKIPVHLRDDRKIRARQCVWELDVDWQWLVNASNTY